YNLTAMADELPSTEHHRRALDRVIFLSDGVFAIAMTLLVLDLRLPPMSVRSSAALRDALLADIPRFISFFISFEVIGIFWLAHLRQFSLIARYTRGLAFINLLFLLSIAIMPFSTTLVGEYGSLSLAGVFYSLSLVFTSVASNMRWLFAVGRRSLLAGADDARGIVVVIDVLRAFSCSALMFHYGIRDLMLVRTPQEALAFRDADPDYLVGGEVKGVKVDGFDLGNSPADIVAKGESFFRGRRVAA